jgi:hypothetical protein
VRFAPSLIAFGNDFSRGVGELRRHQRLLHGEHQLKGVEGRDRPVLAVECVLLERRGNGAPEAQRDPLVHAEHLEIGGRQDRAELDLDHVGPGQGEGDQATGRVDVDRL